MFTEVAFIFESNIVRNNISSSIKHILSQICYQVSWCSQVYTMSPVIKLFESPQNIKSSRSSRFYDLL